MLTEQIRKLHYQVRQKDQIVAAMKEEILSQNMGTPVSAGPSESTDTVGSEQVKVVLPAKISQLFEQDQESNALSKKQIGELVDMIRSPDQIDEAKIKDILGSQSFLLEAEDMRAILVHKNEILET